MFDVSYVSKRYFPITLRPDGGTPIILNLEPPKLKTIRKLASLTKTDGEDAMETLVEIVKDILNKNKERRMVSSDVVEAMDMDQMKAVIQAYSRWIADEKKAKN